MTITAQHDPRIGRTYGPTHYEVGVEKIREYAAVIGETHALHHDRAAAHAADFRDVVAPPMFCVVYCTPPVIQAVSDVIGSALPRMLHGSQTFTWHEPVCSGDTITSVAEIADIYQKGDLTFVKIAGRSHNQDGTLTVESEWTEIVRGGI